MILDSQFLFGRRPVTDRVSHETKGANRIRNLNLDRGDNRRICVKG
jgi:hypothetical protein